MKKVRVEAAFEEFIDSLVIKGRKAETIAYYKEFTAPFFKFAGIKYAAQLSFELVQKYIVLLRGKYENPVTINTHLRAVRAFCYFCGRKNYCVPFAVNLVSAPKTIKVPYDEETVRQLVLNRDLCKPAIAILLMIATGMRAKTLCNIKVGDIDMYGQSILLRELKNNTQTVLPLPVYVCNRVKRYIKENGLTEDDMLLTKRDGTPLNSHLLHGLVSRYLKRKGFDSKGLHRFRHTFAKMTAEEGISSILLSRWLTHSTVEQSEQYVNLYGTALRDSLKYNPIETILRKEKSGQK